MRAENPDKAEGFVSGWDFSGISGRFDGKIYEARGGMHPFTPDD
jgi:hypothetical protein